MGFPPARDIRVVKGWRLSFFDTIVLQLDDKPHQSGRTEKNFTAARLATRRRRRSSAAQRNSNAKPTWAKSGHRRLFILVDQPFRSPSLYLETSSRRRNGS